ncbi:MAG: hypothetical protein AB7P18_21210 [Candidatus Binatia bacterium]
MFLVCVWLCLVPSVQAAGRIAVIAARGSAPETLSIDELERVYLRKKRFWADGTRVVPVNLPATHPLRLAFSRLVLGSLPEAQERYWNEQYFHGVFPPYVLDSEEAVIQFVLSTPGAIGYVDESAVTTQVQVLLYVSRPHAANSDKAVSRTKE